MRGAPLPQRTTREWLDLFAQADIAAKPCHTLESLPQDPHLTQVGLLQPDEHPIEGHTLAIRSTIRFDDSYGTLPSFAQPQGWETRAILKEIGYSAAQVDDLIAEKAAIECSP